MWRRSRPWALLATAAVLWCLHIGSAAASGNTSSVPKNHNKTEVCVINYTGNKKTESLWLRAMPQRYGSRHHYTLHSRLPSGCAKKKNTANNKYVDLGLIDVEQAKRVTNGGGHLSESSMCTHKEICIATGDELCQFPKKYPQSRHVVMREYYSSKYPYPGLPLGPRYEMQWVPPAARVRPGARHYVFNFLGSVNQFKPDRLVMQKVVEDYTWKQPIFWDVVTKFVKKATNAKEYRDTLLNSSFTLCPVGTADESYRFWEAIEAGSIPIYVPRDESLPDADVQRRGKRDCPDSFEDVLRTAPPIVILDSWDKLPAFIEGVTDAQVDAQRQDLARWNHEFWINATRALDNAIDSGIRPE